MKGRPTEREKIFANDMTHKGLNIQKYTNSPYNSASKQTNKQQKANNPIFNMGRNLNRHFSKEDIQTGNNHIKGCSTLVNITEMQVNEISPHTSQNGYHQNDQ